MKGLSFRKTADALSAFVKQHGAAGPRRAVLCTYDLHPSRFEAVVLPELTRRRRWFRTLVLADQAALQQETVLRQRGAASMYQLAPVRLKGPGVFHAKLIVLQAGQRILVGIGSGNLTPGGLGGNLELMLFASNDSTEGRSLAGSAIQFLHDLARAPGIVVPPSAKRFLERICLSAPRSAGGPILHNLDEPLLARIAIGRPARVQRAAVVSPWHSSSASPEGVEPAVLGAVGRALGVRPVVYTEGQAGKGPDLGAGVRVRVLKPSVREAGEEIEAGDDNDDQAARGPRRSATLHAKAYLAVGRRNATLWFGSANCTSPALRHAARGRGNVELLVRIALGRAGTSALEADLASMFEDRKGLILRERTSRIPAPRGWILSGSVSTWRGEPRLILDLVGPSAQPRIVRVGRSAMRASAIAVKVPRGASSVRLDARAIAKLLGGPEAPPVLWEHAGAEPVPFPVSVPCAPIVNDAEAALDDMLDDLAGRVPAAFSRRKASAPTNGEGSSDEDDPEGDDQDRELELLTRSEHQGRLDRVAVRVELLRRRLASAPWGSAEALAHYRSLVDALELAPALRRILVAHIGAARSAR
jgi:hypothetical protein